MDCTKLIPDCMDFYLDGFKKTEYRACFQDYCSKAEGTFREIAAMDPEQAALKLADWMDANPGRFFKARRMADRQMLMLQYTAPAAVKLGQKDFAEALSRIWNKRHPKLPFGVSSFEVLFKGFNNTLLGFQLPNKEED